jgi:hypothetical protein
MQLTFDRKANSLLQLVSILHGRVSRVVGQFDAVVAIPQGGIAKWRLKAASTSN